MSSAGEGDLKLILGYFLAGLLRRKEEESEETEETKKKEMNKDSSSSCASSYSNHVCTKVIRVFHLLLLDLSRKRRTRSGRVFPLLM